MTNLTLMNELSVNVSDLLHRPGGSRPFRLEAEIAAIEGRAATVEPAVVIDVALEHVDDGLLVTGTVAGRWSAECSRCVELFQQEFLASVRELYEPDPAEGETFPIVNDTIDLECVVSEAVLFNLPMTPLCMESCLGLCSHCGVNRNVAPCGCDDALTDPRWEALGALKLGEFQLDDPASPGDLS